MELLEWMKDVFTGKQMNKTMKPTISSVKSIIKLHEKVKKDGLGKTKRMESSIVLSSKDGCS